MAYRLFTFLHAVEPERHKGLIDCHFVDRTSHFCKPGTGSEYTPRVLNEYRIFLKKIYYVLGLDLTEVNMLNGFFFDPDNIQHVPGHLVRALFELITKTDVTADKGKAVMLEIKKRFYREVDGAKAAGRRPPVKFDAPMVRALTDDIRRGRFRPRRGLNPGSRAARLGPPFTTNKWLDIPF